MPKLSEKTAIGGHSQATDFLHIVRAGVSWRMPLSVLFNTAHTFVRSTVNGKELIVFKKNRAGDTTMVLENGDFLIYIDPVEKSVIIGMAIAQVNTYPSDLSDSTVFLKFYEANAAL